MGYLDRLRNGISLDGISDGVEGSISKIDEKSRVSRYSSLKVVDDEWMRNRFLLPDSDVPKNMRASRYHTEGSYKFTDSRVGGNIIINPRPQFTRYADIRMSSRYIRRNRVTKREAGNIGMGRFYSKGIDDNQQAVFLQFGLPKQNSLIGYLLRAVDPQDTIVATRGARSTALDVGKMVGKVGILAAFPFVTIGIWTAKFLTKAILGSGLYEYYYLNPKMHMYWGIVNQITTQISTEIGLLSPVFMDDENVPADKVRVGGKVKISQEDIDAIRKWLPNHFISENNYIDVFSIATRAQILANEQKALEYKILSEKNVGEIDSILAKKLSILDTVDRYTSFDTYITGMNEIWDDVVDEDEENNRTQSPPDSSDNSGDSTTEQIREKKQKTADGLYDEKVTEEETGYARKLAKTIDSTVRQGGAYAAFGVDFTGAATESFSNTSGTINTGDTINQLGQKGRDFTFNFNTGSPTGTYLDDIATGMKDIVTGVASEVTFGASDVINTLIKGGYVMVPKKWDSASYTPNTVSYTMQLRTPYNNPISQIQNLYIPLAMILAGVLPLGTGKSSYTAPMLCSAWSKGVQSIKMGCIRSVTVKRGEGNVGFGKINRNPLSLDITFEIEDFSTYMAAPVNSSVFTNAFSMALEDDTPLGNYIGLIGSRGLLTNKYATHRARLRLSRALMEVEGTFSASNIGMKLGEGLGSILGPVVSPMSLTANFN